MNPILDTKSKLLFCLFAGGILLALFLSYLKFGVMKNYDVYSKVSCNPGSEMCFVGNCDFIDDPRCNGKATIYYKIAQKRAYITPPLECLKNDLDCIEYFCSEENRKEFETDDTCSGTL